MGVEVLKPGMLTTVQDLGRIGSQKYGIIVSGPMDSFAARVANQLVVNDERSALLEVTVIGPTIRFKCDTFIAICGAGFTPTIEGEEVPLWRAVHVRKDSVLKFGNAAGGSRCYLALAGGVDVPEEIGSRSTYLRAGIGGYQGRALQLGDELNRGEAHPDVQNKLLLLKQRHSSLPFFPVTSPVFRHLLPAYSQHPTIRIIRGMDHPLFDERSQRHLLSDTYTVLPQSDRMGYRLEGPPLRLTNAQEMVSAAVTFGTIQVPVDGNPIVLMADRQTTGGYPIIGQVITVDLPLMAQLNPGSTIRFKEVTLDEAQQLYLLREDHLNQLKLGIGLAYRTR